MHMLSLLSCNLAQHTRNSFEKKPNLEKTTSNVPSVFLLIYAWTLPLDGVDKLMKFSILSLVHNLSLQQAQGLPSLSRGYTGIQS